MNALISVSDKTGVVELAQALHALGVGLISTGGTAQLLSSQGLPVREVADLTGVPEMLDGRVKTLHPKVHGGLLARRDLPEHMQALQDQAIETIDVLVVNLCPFEATVAMPDCTLEDAIENIDIGGPAMVRSAAKNWKHVVVLTDGALGGKRDNLVQLRQREVEAACAKLGVSSLHFFNQPDRGVILQFSAPALPSLTSPGQFDVQGSSGRQ